MVPRIGRVLRLKYVDKGGIDFAYPDMKKIAGGGTLNAKISEPN